MLDAHRQHWHDRDLLQNSTVNSISQKQTTIYTVLSHFLGGYGDISGPSKKKPPVSIESNLYF